MRMTKSGGRQIATKESTTGTSKVVSIEHLINEEERGNGCGLFAEVTIEVGATLGYHEHHGETETYYITQGSGMYRDNDKLYPVSVGDVVFCKDGDGHGLANTCDVDLKFVALILKK